MKLGRFVALLVVGVMSGIVSASPVVVIDSGHEPSRPGATGTCGKQEVSYNDDLVKVLAHTLSKQYTVVLTRQYGQEVNLANSSLDGYIKKTEKHKWVEHKNLYARPAIANLNQAALFIAIHHDSVQSRYQIKQIDLCDERGGKTIQKDFKNKYTIGFNVFVYDDQSMSQRKNSIKFANLIGAQLVQIGRHPSNYHVSPDGDCQSCRPINLKTGVWHEDLAVLRNASMSAVLIEVGNIVDSQDEAKINNEQFKKMFSLAIKRAIDAYFGGISNQ